MDRVGGYASYVALQADRRDYGDVLIVLAGEAEAHRMRKLREEQQRGKRRQ